MWKKLEAVLHFTGQCSQMAVAKVCSWPNFLPSIKERFRPRMCKNVIQRGMFARQHWPTFVIDKLYYIVLFILFLYFS
jgi:hypothetical protein